jgi:hypothetical protein
MISRVTIVQWWLQKGLYCCICPHHLQFPRVNTRLGLSCPRTGITTRRQCDWLSLPATSCSQPECSRKVLDLLHPAQHIQHFHAVLLCAGAGDDLDLPLHLVCCCLKLRPRALAHYVSRLHACKCDTLHHSMSCVTQQDRCALPSGNLVRVLLKASDLDAF